MTRLVQITTAQARRLHQAPGRGTALMFRFLPPEPRDKAQKWAVESLAGILHSLPHPHEAKSFEVWLTSTEINLVVWTPHPDDARRLLRHWQNFNPAIQQQAPSYPFPPIRPGSWIRVAQLRPRRASRHPIETRYGQQGHKMVTSPVVHVLNNLPLVPDGTTLILQVTWHKSRVPWKWSPWSYLDWKPGLGRDMEALFEKAQHRATYYADVRIAEIHAQPSDVHYTNILGHALMVYNRDNANRLTLKRRLHWSKNRIVSFLGAMRRRDVAHSRHRLWNRPRYTATELACLVHPPPPGSLVPDLASSNVRPIEASGGTTHHGEALRRFVTRHEQVRGTSRKLKATDVVAHRRREDP